MLCSLLTALTPLIGLPRSGISRSGRSIHVEMVSTTGSVSNIVLPSRVVVLCQWNWVLQQRHRRSAMEMTRENANSLGNVTIAGNMVICRGIVARLGSSNLSN